jgi:gliding motility-associated-like protein
MKKFLLATLLAGITNFIVGQTFTNTIGGNIPDGFGPITIGGNDFPDPGPRVCFPINVTGVGPLTATSGLTSVCINITHTYDEDLVIFLRAPTGEYIPLSGVPNIGGNGGAGENYTNTCFTMSATTPIWLGNAPFTGSYLPEYPLGWFNNNNINGNGTWNLCVEDGISGDIGRVNSWNITFGANPPAYPVTGCAGNAAANNFCQNATPICNLNGYCGRTSGLYSAYVWDELETVFGACGSIENNSFIKFVASAPTATFNVAVTSITTQQQGIQMMVFSGGCGSGPVTNFGCTTQMLPGNNTFTATGLTPGNTYFLMIDGYNGDVCDYTITASNGVNILNITPAAPNICAGGTGRVLTASGGNGTYTWAPATGLSATTGATVTANPTVTTTYTVTSGAIGSLNCPLTKTVTVTVNPPPTVTAPATVCIGNTGTLSPTTGGTWVSSNPTIATVTNAGVVTGIAAGNATFTFTNSTTGCSSTTTAITVNANNTIPSFNPIAPICSGTTAPILPTTSNNGITGTWAPATVSNTTTTTYTFTPAAGQCATAVPLTITVNPVLTPTVNCGVTTPSSVTFDWAAVTGATGYTISYTINGGAPISGGTITLTTFSVTALPANANVLITVTPTGNGCFASGTRTCVSTACVAATATLTSAANTNNQTICTPAAFTNITYAIGGSATGATVTGLPTTITGVYSSATGILTISGTTNTTAGTYNYTVSTTGGCSVANATGTIIVNSSTLPTFTTIAPLCVGVTAPLLPLTSTNGIAGTWSPATINTATAGSTVYAFTPTTGQCASTATLTVVINSATTPTFTPIPTLCLGSTPPILPATSNNGVAGVWAPATINTATLGNTQYTFTPSATQCAAPTTITVTVDNSVVPTFNAIAPFCAGTTPPTLQAISNNGINGTWNSATINNTISGNYTFTPAAGACATTAAINVNVLPAPQVNLGIDTAICLNATYLLNATQASNTATYLWQDNTTQPTFTATQAGTYRVTVTNNGCSKSDTVVIQNKQVPQFTLGTNITICPSQTVVLNPGLTAPSLTYLWQDGSTSAQYTITSAGTYFVDVTNNCGTTRGIANVTVGVCKFWMPNSFTPNGDGRNDVYRPAGSAVVSNYNMQIFNRYGEKIFETKDATKGWTGMYKNKKQPTGTYVYYVSYTDITTNITSKVRGSFLLLH